MAKLLVGETIGSVLHFPIWWYTEGFVEAARWSWRGLNYRWRSAGLTVWLQNLFVPMYGQYDWSGRAISLFMRIVVLIFRLISIFVEAIGYLLLLICWALAPALSLVFFLEAVLRHIA